MLACPSPPDAEDTAQKSPPYQEWPEIEQSNRFYVFPTIGAYYQPYFNLSCVNVALNSFRNEPMMHQALLDGLLHLVPSLEPYKHQLLPMIVKFGQTQFNPYDVHMAIFEIISTILNDPDVLGKPLEQEGYRNLVKELGLRNDFCITHEGMHLLSLQINRPVIKEFKEITLALFNLISHQVGTDIHSDFLVRFHELNNKLEDCLYQQLALEELRATIYALEDCSPQTRLKIIDEVYPEGSEDQEAQIFHELRSLTGDGPYIAWLLTLLVENLNPSNPLGELKNLQCVLNAERAFTWSENQWSNWLASFNEFDEAFDSLEEILNQVGGYFKPTTFIQAFPNSRTIIFCPDNMGFMLFLESMRQQLANPKLLRSLVCPFKEQGHLCCGLGNHIRGIWASIPNEYRERLNPPALDCLSQN